MPGGDRCCSCGVWPCCADVAAQGDREHSRCFAYSRWHDLQQKLWNSGKILAWNSYSSLCIKTTHDYNADLLHFVLIRKHDQTICLLRPFDFCSFLSYPWIYGLSVIKKSFPFWYNYSLDAVSFVCTINITVTLTRKLKRSPKLTVLGWCTANELCPVGIIPVPEHHTSCI